MIKAIILDWSGVLSDDLSLVYRIAKKMFDHLGHKFMSIKEFRERFDLPYMDFYRSLGINTEKGELDSIGPAALCQEPEESGAIPLCEEDAEMAKEAGSGAHGVQLPSPEIPG